MNVREYYDQALARRGFARDAAQEAAVDRLQQMHEEWVAFRAARSSALRKLFHRPEVPRGVYLWGGVGRGKSFIMDAFYATVPLKRKTRLHFHEFMRGVHQGLTEVRGQADPLDEVARRVARRHRLICFDEFHVSDVADAMILYRLLERLFALGTTFVMTSNYEPSTLYPDGLHRDRILPAIDLIYERLDVMNVDGGQDYRRKAEIEDVSCYLHPLGEATDKALQATFERLLDGPRLDETLEIEQRRIRALAHGRNIVWFDFETLCGGPRSQNDYLVLAERFDAVIVSGVPCMGPRQASAARRFTWLVDVFYDHKVKLILSAECPPDALYVHGALANEFQRTVSRLMEMQGREYLQSERRAAATL
ncbi:MAG: cell division protein ZapE [Castellaniella sp.]